MRSTRIWHKSANNTHNIGYIRASANDYIHHKTNDACIWNIIYIMFFLDCLRRLFITQLIVRSTWCGHMFQVCHPKIVKHFSQIDILGHKHFKLRCFMISIPKIFLAVPRFFISNSLFNSTLTFWNSCLLLLAIKISPTYNNTMKWPSVRNLKWTQV